MEKIKLIHRKSFIDRILDSGKGEGIEIELGNKNKCKSCGKKIGKKAKFCEHCGKKQ